LQAASFGAKAVWIKDNKWQHSSFRNSYSRPMNTAPQILLNRVELLARDFVGIKGLNHSILELNTFPNNSVIYIDPPYKNTTKYGHTFNVIDYLSKVDKKVYISEGYKMFDDAHLIPQGRCTTGINGKRKTKENEEWLNIFIPK